MAMEPGRRPADPMRWLRRASVARVGLWFTVVLVGGIVALATGHTDSGQAALFIVGVCALGLLAAWLRSRRQRPH